MSYVNTLKLNNIHYENTDSYCRKSGIDLHIHTYSDLKDALYSPESNQKIMEILSDETKTLISKFKNDYQDYINLTTNIATNPATNPAEYYDEAIKTYSKRQIILEREKNLNELQKQIFISANLVGKIRYQQLDDGNEPYVYDDINFFNQPINYDTLRDEQGQVQTYMGVCNPKLLHYCNNVKVKDQSQMTGICTPNNYTHDNQFYLSNLNLNGYELYKTNYNFTAKKLSSGYIIPETLDSSLFASKYCETGQFKTENDQNMCL